MTGTINAASGRAGSPAYVHGLAAERELPLGLPTRLHQPLLVLASALQS